MVVVAFAMLRTPFCASIYARMPSALTEPTVAAKYERVHKDGNLLKIGLNSCRK